MSTKKNLLEEVELHIETLESDNKELSSSNDYLLRENKKLEKQLENAANKDSIIKAIHTLRTDEVCEIYRAILESHHSTHLDKF